MTIDQMIAQVRQSLADKLAKRNEHTATIEQVRSTCLAEQRDPTDVEAQSVRAASDAKGTIDTEIETLQAREAELLEEKRRDDAAAALARDINPTPGGKPTGRARVTGEPRTYSADKSQRGEASFFVDAFRAAQLGDFAARERVERHMQEAAAEGELTARATTTGSFGGLIVPQYLVDQAALLARAGRPFANSVTRLQLPEQGMSLIIPRGTTGAATAVQATENSSVQNTDEVFANVTVPVITVGGQQDVSRQSLERGTPGIDELIYMDLAGAYAVTLDGQVISGSGSSGQALGVVNTSGVNQATAFGAAATPTTFYTKVAGQVNAVQTTRFLPPTAIAMHPRRWNWLVGQVDSNGRPLVLPSDNGPFNALGIVQDGPVDPTTVSPAGGLQGLPVIVDANVPTGVGSGPEDQVIVYRREDLILWEEGDGQPKQLRFEQTLGNQLTVKLVVYGYAAFTAGRYPTAVGIVGGNATVGNGLVAPTF